MARHDNPCTRCGACCASFRVDFARDELHREGGQVPDALAVDLGGHTCRLRGTDHQPPRCAALVGHVGERVRCAIHEWRPSPCREFGLRAPLGIGDDACDRTRPPWLAAARRLKPGHRRAAPRRGLSSSHEPFDLKQAVAAPADYDGLAMWRPRHAFAA